MYAALELKLSLLSRREKEEEREARTRGEDASWSAER